MVAFATQVKRRRGTQEQNDAFTGAEGEIVVDLTNMTLRVHDGRTQGGFVVGGGAGRNIGDIFFTARTDTSLNGAVEANGGQYNTTDFVGAESIGNILSAGNVPYVTIADFDTAVANNGECTSFGWDGGTVFKVPKINGRRLIRRQLPTADNNYTWYNLYSDGYVEQGGVALLASGNNSIPMAITMNGAYETYTPQVTAGVASSNARIVQVLDSSTATTLNVVANSSFDCFWQVNGYAAESEYIDKSTWQYDRYMRPMVQLANGATDEAVVVAGNVLADIAGIKDGDGFTQPGKNAIVGWSMPDYSAGVSTNIPYTAQNKCFVVAYASASNQAISFMINGEVVSTNGGTNATYYSRVGFYLDTGDVLSCTTSATGIVYPLKGVN